uniref:Class II histone deacetylase n=1 Tax=Thermomicrobium roseum TaxID=500 RepID=A0A7C5VWH1_THERO
MERIGYCFDETFLGHDTGLVRHSLPNGVEIEPVEHPSSVRITRRTAELIHAAGLATQFEPISARPATFDELTLYHDIAYIERVHQITRVGGLLDPETPVTQNSWQAALFAAGAAIETVNALLAHRARKVFALLRPPGHHALADRSMGFCIFNNIVLAARYAQQNNFRKIMIIDWDVHHGNGTQAAFWNDPDVLFISLHQDNWYPRNSGSLNEVGGKGAEGTTVNIPLPPGCGNRAYLLAMEAVVIPIARQFQPDLILISAGQDPSMDDPLGRMLVTTKGFRLMAETMRKLADELCAGHLIAFQEGGYSLRYTPFCTLAVIEGISNIRTGIPDPFSGNSELQQAEEEYRPHQEAAVEAVIRAQRPYWAL